MVLVLRRTCVSFAIFAWESVTLAFEHVVAEALGELELILRVDEWRYLGRF
jgi:hypothetical protein